MRVILKQDVAKVGRKGEMKEVNDGYARNFLLAQGKAVVADAARLADWRQLRQAGETKRASGLAAVDRLRQLTATSPLKLSAKANAAGHLFAAVREQDLAMAVSRQFGLELDPKIFAFKTPIKAIGAHEIMMKIGGRTASVPLVVTGLT